MNFKTTNFILLSWILNASDKIDFAVGGQAVIEGVMMRSPNNITIAVRKEDKTIKVKKKKYRTLTQRYKVLNVPILRGVINLFEMMVVGTQAINFSANVQLEDISSEQSRSAAERPSVASKASNLKTEKDETNKKPTETKLSKIAEIAMFSLSLILALALSITLFKFIPLGLTTLLEKRVNVIQENYMLFNLIDGLLKMFIFLSYIFILSLIPSFRRIFEYHGAEHKSIFAYEQKLDLTVENAKKQTRFHPRCGTSFILIVFIISIAVYTVIPKQPSFLENLGIRLAALPLIAGISYEYLKFSAKYSKSLITKIFIAPGLFFQRLTTKEPSNGQLEVGLKSLKESLEMERAG